MEKQNERKKKHSGHTDEYISLTEVNEYKINGCLLVTISINEPSLLFGGGGGSFPCIPFLISVRNIQSQVLPL